MAVQMFQNSTSKSQFSSKMYLKICLCTHKFMKEIQALKKIQPMKNVQSIILQDLQFYKFYKIQAFNT